MRDIINRLEELNVDNPTEPVQEILSSKGRANLAKMISDFERQAEDMNLSQESMDAVAMGLDQIMADVQEIEGVMENKVPVKEDLGNEAQMVEKDHEVQMARGDLYKAAKYAVTIHKMMKDISEMEGIEGWVASKITKAADYLGSVKHYMESQMVQDVELAVVPVAGDMTDAMTMPEESVEEVSEDSHDKDHAKLHKAIKKKLKDEGGAAGMEPLKKIAKDMDIDLTPAMLSKIDGVKKHRDGDYILEDDTDYPQVANRNIDKKNVMDILKKFPKETKQIQMDGTVDNIYDTPLYQELMDYYADEMPYGTMKARDGDPIQYINDELDELGLFDEVIERMIIPMPKQQTNPNPQPTMKDMLKAINSKIYGMKRDPEEKGIDGPAQTMPKVKQAPVNPVTQRKMQNKQALANSKYADWGKK